MNQNNNLKEITFEITQRLDKTHFNGTKAITIYREKGKDINDGIYGKMEQFISYPLSETIEGRTLFIQLSMIKEDLKNDGILATFEVDEHYI